MPVRPRVPRMSSSNAPSRFATSCLPDCEPGTRPPLSAISAVLDRRIPACRLEPGTTTTGIVVGSIRYGAKPRCRWGLAHGRSDRAGYFPGPRPKSGPDRAPISSVLALTLKTDNRLTMRVSAMARPGLEPGTPRFSVGRSEPSGWPKTLETMRVWRKHRYRQMSAICGLFPPLVGMAGASGPTSTRAPSAPGVSGAWPLQSALRRACPRSREMCVAR
jgi:hypothetical protein